MWRSGLVIAIMGIAILSPVLGDTPANCTYEDIRGDWVFSVGSTRNNASVNCTKFKEGHSKVMVSLQYPDIAVDEFGNMGFWTIIYNQGFEVVVGGRKYVGFSKYEKKGKKTTSLCNDLQPGWSHDVLGHNWACFTGQKKAKAGNMASGRKVSAAPTQSLSSVLKFEPIAFVNDMDLISGINEAQKSWKAAPYPHLEGLSRESLLKMAGGRASRIANRPKSAPVTDEVLAAVAKLPDNFDWRNVSGVSYVSPIRNQALCGSCYAFGSLAMIEARIRIISNNTQQPIFSPQDIMGCSHYSQGCEGGFPYMIGGKYAEDFGLVLEAANPYRDIDDEGCNTNATAARYYSTNYAYIGGYYGACNEPLMRLALYENGPITVGFEVLDDFYNYQSGIYHHTGLSGPFKPFELTNHAVLAVGYGVDKATGDNYWIVKNSWGVTWGEKGYFRIRRGNDECGFESTAMQSTPVIPL